jgi:ParB family chromosome partitioning protein
MEVEAASVLQVPVGQIKPNPRQPRDHMAAESLEELANSIRVHGILQPLLVTRDTLSGEYILIAGERRLQAARLAGLEAVPALLSMEDGDQARLELALIENLQRADLTPLEEAEAYHHLVEDFGLTQEDVAARVGKSRPAVANTLRLLNLAPAARKALADDKISEGHARALLSLSHPSAQEAALQTVLKNELNVRQTEQLIQRLTGQKQPRQHVERQAEVEEVEQRLRNRLGTRVTLRPGKRGGTLTIHYFSNEELDSILAEIMKE